VTVWHLAAKEIAYRKLNFGLGLLSVVVAVGCLVGALTLLSVHDARTRQVLARREQQTQERMAALSDDVRKAMLTLGFNIVILPKDQNLSDWYAEDYGSKYMPEQYVERLAESDIVTVRHLLPSLQQKVKWPERERTIILVGTRGEVPPLHRPAKKPLLQPVPAGTIVLGHELHRSMGLNVGDSVMLLGHEFTVSKCHPERGTKDDITAWIDLAEAQELLDKRGLINAILALECICAEANVGKVRADITRVLPDTQVIERGSKALARAEARTRVARQGEETLERERHTRATLRREREELASVLVPVVMVAATVWIAFLAFGNVRERRSEIAILRTLGLRSRQVLLLFLSRAIAMGLAGGVLGCALGFLVGKRLGIALDTGAGEALAAGSVFEPALVALALVVAPVLAGAASWIPAVVAAREDPAVILQEA